MSSLPLSTVIAGGWVGGERLGEAWQVSAGRSHHVTCVYPLHHKPCSIRPGVCADADLAVRAIAVAGSAGRLRVAGAAAAGANLPSRVVAFTLDNRFYQE
jgi:hypothetical protein